MTDKLLFLIRRWRNMKKSAFLLLTTVTVAVLAACMTPPPRSEDHTVGGQQVIQEEKDRIDALTNAGKNFSRIVTVPAANNMLSNGVAVGVLRMGSGSASADTLLEILQKGEEQAVAVVGKSDALTTATIEATIQQLDDHPTATTVLFAGEQEYVMKLQKAAEKAGVPFEWVVFP
jgi:hypothetical protein